jgi:hypothetical protein
MDEFEHDGAGAEESEDPLGAIARRIVDCVAGGGACEQTVVEILEEYTEYIRAELKNEIKDELMVEILMHLRMREPAPERPPQSSALGFKVGSKTGVNALADVIGPLRAGGHAM